MFRGIFALLLSFYFCSIAVRAEMRAFELPDGRTLEAEIVDYNSSKGQITLKRADGKKVSIKPGIFVEKDQAYIKEWVAAQDFLSNKILSIKIEKNRIDSSTFKTGSKRKSNETFAYDIQLANRGRKKIECRAEYRIFFYQEAIDPDGTSYLDSLKTKGVLPSTFESIDIAAGSKSTLQTESIKISQVQLTMPGDANGNSSDSGKKLEGELYGIWLKFYYMQSNGTELVRDLCLPENVSSEHTWNEKSKSW